LIVEKFIRRQIIIVDIVPKLLSGWFKNFMMEEEIDIENSLDVFMTFALNITCSPAPRRVLVSNRVRYTILHLLVVSRSLDWYQDCFGSHQTAVRSG